MGGDFGLTTFIPWTEEELQSGIGLYVSIGLTTFAEESTIELCFNFDMDPIPGLMMQGLKGPPAGSALKDYCAFCWPSRDCTGGNEEGYWNSPGIDIGTTSERQGYTGVYVTTYIASMADFDFATS